MTCWLLAAGHSFWEVKCVASYCSAVWSCAQKPRTSNNAATRPSVEPVFFHFSFLCGASWLSGSVYDVQARDRGFDTWLRWICSDDGLLGKALCWHVHSLDPGVSGYLVGQWRLLCLNSFVRRKMAAGLWPVNGQVLWPGGNCVKSDEWRFALDTRL